MQITRRQTEPSLTAYKVEYVFSALDEAWPVVEPMIQAALDRGGDDIPASDVKALIADKRASLWVVREGGEIVAAQVMHLPDDRDAVMVWLMGGRDFIEWQPVMQPLLQRYAREHGRRFVECNARPGIGRILRKQGWRTSHELVRLEASQ